MYICIHIKYMCTHTHALCLYTLSVYTKIHTNTV